MNKDKKSFFERLTGSVQISDKEQEINHGAIASRETRTPASNEWVTENSNDGELTVDVYQTDEEIVIQTMVAGVRPEDLDISITRDMVTIKGERESGSEVGSEGYFHKELYWGSFSRTILLPEEVDVESSEASEKYGMLTIKLAKLDKNKKTKLKVKSTT